MKGNRTAWVALLAASVFLFLVMAPPASGENGPSIAEQMKRVQAEMLASHTVTGVKNPSRPNFGTHDASVVNVHAYEFQGQKPFFDDIRDDGNGYRYFASIAAPSSAFMAAPVSLPSGVIIDEVAVSDCINTDGDFLLGLWDGGYGGTGGPNITFVSVISSCGTDTSFPAYEYDANLGHPLWLLLFWTGATDGSTKFNDVAITYHRIVSPAPGSPTFNDVPVSDPGFQYIEALVASGVTAGCGGGNYCPDNPLTRRQMAVFLAKAFGLHWPN